MSYAPLIDELRTRVRLAKSRQPGASPAMEPNRNPKMREMGRAEILEAAAQAIEDLEALLDGFRAAARERQ